MDGPKFRENNIMKIIEESLSRLPPHEWISVELESSLDDEAVWLDQEQMLSVLMDLEQNAVESMPDGGRLTISVTGDEEHITLLLTDTGSGITLENSHLLFTPFFTTKPVCDGTGLGLPLAYATVKAHNGNIMIESNADPGREPTGTKVRITIPRLQTLQKKSARIILHED